jgi:uncharacterized protein (DUF58 family)
MAGTPLAAYWRRLLRWVTLDQRVQLAQPGMLIICLCALLLALAFPSRWLLYGCYVYLLLVLGAYPWVRAIGPYLRIERQLETAWAQVGDELEERWTLANRSPLPLHWLAIDDLSTLPGYNARRVVSGEAGQTERWRTSARCERRGSYTLGPLTASFSDPFDIFRFVWREQATRQLIVYPPLVRLPPLPLPRGLRGGLAQADLLQLYATPSVGGLRDYTPGDPPSRIHWPHVARHQRLVVKEFDQERAGALWIILDLAAAAYPPTTLAPPPSRPPESYIQRSAASPLVEARPPSLIELAITLAASLAAQLLAEGRVVGLLCDDGRRRTVTPGSGNRQLWQILNELVDSGASGQQPLGTLLRQSQGRSSTMLADAALVVITPALDGAWLPALAAQGSRPGGALALLVAAEAAQAASCSALLAAQGVAARTFTLGTALPLVNPPRVRTRVSPLGRVIRTEGDSR